MAQTALNFMGTNCRIGVADNKRKEMVRGFHLPALKFHCRSVAGGDREIDRDAELEGSFCPPRFWLSYFSISTDITAPLACGNTALIFTTLRLSFATHKVVVPGSPSADVSSTL